jgi:hypothetical protein
MKPINLREPEIAVLVRLDAQVPYWKRIRPFPRPERHPVGRVARDLGAQLRQRYPYNDARQLFAFLERVLIR